MNMARIIGWGLWFGVCWPLSIAAMAPLYAGRGIAWLLGATAGMVEAMAWLAALPFKVMLLLACDFTLRLAKALGEARR